MADEKETAPSKVEVFEPPMTMDGLEVSNPEPGKEYRWLNRNVANVNRKRLMQGWKPVDGASPVEAGVRQADGTRMAGDAILAERSIEAGNVHRERIRRRKALLEGVPKQAFVQAAEDANREARDKGFTGRGVSTFEVGEGGSEDEKQLSKPHRRSYRMGAGINKETGELDR